VESGLEELRRQRATLQDIEGRGAQNGDVLNAELQVFMDGESKGEEPGNLRGFVLGESGFVPSIDEHLLGATLDEERRFPVSYPEDFRDEELAGKSAEFAVKITALKERVLPELTDEFAQTLGLEDMTAVREKMREAIEQGRTTDSQNAVRQEIVGKLVEGTTFEVPTALLERRAQVRVQNVEGELQGRGGTLDEYLKASGKTREEFEADVRAEIEIEMKQELVLDEIAQRENIKAQPDEIENHYYQVAQAMGQPVEKIVERLDIEQARASIQQRKALDWLLAHAQITEGEPLKDEDAEESTQEGAVEA
jgi:trigger factor